MPIRIDRIPSGDLEIKVVPDEDEADRDWDRLLKQPTLCALSDLLEESGKQGYGWSVISGEDTGDMTDSPMITDDYTVEDNGDEVIYGSVWWFPNYQIEDPIETLREKGRVIFKLGYKERELVPFKYTPKGRAVQKIVSPHGMCEKSCVEHARDKSVPSCKPRRMKGRRS